MDPNPQIVELMENWCCMRHRSGRGVRQKASLPVHGLTSWAALIVSSALGGDEWRGLVRLLD